MGENWLKRNISSESMSAIFIIVLVSLFILSNFAVGFVLPLYILVMTLAFLIAFFYPRSGIYAIVFLTILFERFFTLQAIFIGKGEYKLYPIDIILGAVIIGSIFELLSRKEKIQLKNADFYLIGFMFFVAIYFLISALVLKSDFSLAFSSFKNYVFYSLLYFLVLFLLSKEEYIKRLFKFFLSGAVTIICFIIYGLAMRHGLWSDFTPLSTEGVRTLAFTHAFYLGLPFLGILAFSAFKKTEEQNSYYFPLLLIWSLGIAGSMMRHLWAGLAIAALALYFLIAGKQRAILRKTLIKYLAVLLIATIAVIYLSSLFPYSGFSETANSTQKVIETRLGSVFSASQDESFSWRNLVWNEGMKEYLKNPVFGLGLGKRIYVESEGYRDFVEVRNIHNSLLVLLFQFGVIPFFLFLVFVFKNLKSLIRSADQNWIDAALAGMLAYYLVIFLFQPYLETNLLGIFFWIILGLIAARSRKVEPAKITEAQP